MRCSVVLDSGAFSAWTKRLQIDLDEYAAFARRNSEFIDTVVNLDCIPGEFGRVPDSAEVEASAQKGWENLLHLENEWGIRAMPVFHMGERLKWLDRMIDHGCDYVGISPANDRTTNQKRAWLDDVYDHICDADGWPIIKTHGFGVTSVPILFRYPWYSADSTSWALFGAYGMILVPQQVNGQFCYTISPHSVVVSKESSLKDVEGARHFDTFSPTVKRHIEGYLESCGVTASEIRENYKARDRVNIRFFLDVSDKMVPKPFLRGQGKFFL